MVFASKRKKGIVLKFLEKSLWSTMIIAFIAITLGVIIKVFGILESNPPPLENIIGGFLCTGVFVTTTFLHAGRKSPLHISSGLLATAAIETMYYYMSYHIADTLISALFYFLLMGVIVSLFVANLATDRKARLAEEKKQEPVRSVGRQPVMATS